MAIEELIMQTAADGGPYGIAALGWLAWIYERRANKEGNQRLLELATAQIEAAMKQEQAIKASMELMERVLVKD